MRPLSRRRAAVLLALLAAPWLPVEAQGRAISVETAWARPSVAGGGRTGAAYFEVFNLGQRADRLIAARSDLAEAAEIHSHVKDGDIMRMRAVTGVDVAPGASVPFAPGGYHIMLLGLKKPLAEGDTLPLTLVFETAGEIKLEVPVRRDVPRGSR